MSFSKIISAFTLIVIGAASPLAAQPQKLPNGGFEDGLKNWTTRSQTAGVYDLLSRGEEGGNAVEMTVGEDGIALDGEAVYCNRRDLPAEEGYYRIRFMVKSSLQKGSGGALIVAFDADEKILARFSPGQPGIPSIMGETPWTEYSFVYQVPPKATMTVLQLQATDLQGSLAFDSVSVERLDSDTGKKEILEQSDPTKRLVIPPFVEVKARTPQFPLKTARVLTSASEVEAARANIAKYPEARVVLDALKKQADPWLEWSDEDLRKLLTSARVPRAFDLNPKGCPVHGDAVFHKGGTYPWILDPRHPLKVTCPVGGESYPSNDYESYANSGFKEKEGWDTAYVDDGFGWVAPDGERYWFVAYANQWNWYKTISPAILNLSRVYVLTGDKRYAHKAAVMLYRMAEVYPEMDHESQSRFGLMSKARGARYAGKVLNHIWETFFSRDFAESYDAVWDSIDGDAELQKLYGKTGAELRGFIEANLLEDAVDAYFSERIQGNFGMHQNALLHILLARQTMDLKKYFHLLVDDPGAQMSYTGLRYALYNQVWRDGAPFESPGYNWLWLENFAALADLLKKGDTDLFREPKMKLLFDAPLDQVNIGLYTPSLGDTGGVLGGIEGRSAEVYASVYAAYKEARYQKWMALAGEADNKGFTTYHTLFNTPVAKKALGADRRAVAPQVSRLQAGYGLGILNNPADTTSLTMTYGTHISHYHWDFLHFDLFANGQAMMPDLGYPDAMNGYVSSIYTWSTNTIAHNTVVVDAGRQQLNVPGVLHDFAVSPFARSIDASSAPYSQTETYRRNLIQVDVTGKDSYVLDVFHVKGGKQHDYSLHGPPGEVQAYAGTWSAPAPGTLAGPAVPLGEIYDDAALSVKDYTGAYSDYHGSGFQHLFNVQKLERGNGALQYRHVRDAGAQLRIHPLTQGAQEVFIADAYDLPRGRKNLLKYSITRRKSTDNRPLESTFVSVLEPFSAAPYIKDAERLALNGGSGVAVRVRREGATDIILSDMTASKKVLAAYALETDANSAVVTLDAANRLVRVFFSGGTYLKCGKERFAASATRGTVTSVDAMAQTVNVALTGKSAVKATALAGGIAHFESDLRQTVHPLAGVTREGDTLTLKTRDAVLVGRAQVKGMQKTSVLSDTSLPLAATYNGTTLLSSDFRPLARVKAMKTGEIELADEPALPIAAGKDVWFANIGVGDKVEFPASFHWSRKE